MITARPLYENVIVGLALAPQSVNNAAVNGPDIAAPWKLGGQLSILLLGGALGTATTGTFKVQGKDSAGSYAALKDKDGNDLAFTAADLADAGPLENGVLMGTLDTGGLTKDGTALVDLVAVRVVYDNDVAVANLVGAAYVISDLYNRPSSTSDQLWAKQHALP